MKRRLLALSVLALVPCEGCGCGGGGGGDGSAVADSAATAAWSQIGFAGKTIRSLTYDPSTSTLYAAVENEGLYKTVDDGATWFRSLEGDVRSVAVDPAGTLYAATGNGLYRSSDAGVTWSWIDLNQNFQTQMVVMVAGPIPPPPSQSLNVVIADPTLPGIVYAGGESGVYSSQDGKLWRNEPKVGPVRDLAIGTIGSYRCVYAATDSGIHRLTLNSPTQTEHYWSLVMEEATTALAVDSANAWTLYAAFVDRFARSFEGGASKSWTPILQGKPRDVVLPAAGILYAATVSGIFYSDDMGGTWIDRNFAGPAPMSLAAGKGVLFVGTQGGGVWKESP